MRWSARQASIGLALAAFASGCQSFQVAGDDDDHQQTDEDGAPAADDDGGLPTGDGQPAGLDCSATPDHVDCDHAVECAAFSASGAEVSPFVDALKTPEPNRVCTEGGECGTYLGCRTTEAGDGHSHAVEFKLFDDGYTNLTAAVPLVRFNTECKACSPGGTCRIWFGRGRTTEDSGHTHAVTCHLFNGGYSEIVGPADAIDWSCPRTKFNWGSGGYDDYRTYWGRCQIE